jgi:hypothetical protein
MTVGIIANLKDIARADISEFESHQPSQVVQSPRCDFSGDRDLVERHLERVTSTQSEIAADRAAAFYRGL